MFAVTVPLYACGRLIMRTSTEGRKIGIQWTLSTQLDDLDFADDQAPLYYNHARMQDKTKCLKISAKIGLHIHKGKTKVAEDAVGQ